MKRTVRTATTAAGLLACLVVGNHTFRGSAFRAATLHAETQNDAVGVRHCSARTLLGRYGLWGTGTIDGVPVAFVGAPDFDGAGKVTGVDWASFNGNTSTRTIEGSYQVNEDCTGSVTFVSPTRDVEVHFALVIVDDGKEVFWIETDAGTVNSGTLKRL